MAIIDGVPQNDDADWIPDDDEEDDFDLEIIEDDEDQKIPDDKDEEKGETEEVKQDRVQKRIDQLTASKYEEQRRAEAAEARLKEMQDRIDRIESGVSESQQNGFKEKYEKVKSELFQAAEEGDTKKQVELTEQLADMRADIKMDEARRAYAKRNPAPTEKQPQQVQAPAAAYAWWNRNTWFNTQGKEAESAYAKQVDVQMEREGLDKNSPEYYSELDNRLQKRFPELYSSHAPNEKRPPRSPVAPSGNQRQGRKPSKGTVRLTRDQINMAKELGLTTPAELKAYAKEIQEASK